MRCPAPQLGRLSRSSGRVRTSTKSGLDFDHSSRYSTNSRRLASAHCMSSNTRTVGYVFASRSKKSRQAAKRSWRSCEDCSSAIPSRLASIGSTKRPLVPVEHVLGERRVELRARSGIVVVLGDAGAHAHHVGERPVGHSLAVGETAAAVPVDVVDETVEVLVELPREPRLADPGDAHRGDEMRRCAPRRRRGRAP